MNSTPTNLEPITRTPFALPFSHWNAGGEGRVADEVNGRTGWTPLGRRRIITVHLRTDPQMSYTGSGV